MARHPRLVLLALLVLILAILGVTKVAGQVLARSPVASVDVRAAAERAGGLRVIVSLAERRLRVVGEAGDTLLTAPVAIGSGRTLRSGGQAWAFVTPRGVRTVVSKDTEPVWVRPDWSYVEAARANHLRVDSISERRPRRLTDGRILTVRGTQVGVLRDSSTFEPLPVDDEIVFGGILFIPPIGTEHRGVPGQLGHYRLNLGSGIGVHGTPDRTSIGHAVTHGCLRLADDALEWVFHNVPVGTRVFIY